MNGIVLFGAGTTGRVIARHLNAKGTPPLCFVDSNPEKWGLEMEGVKVIAKGLAHELYPSATWIASAIVPSFHKEITAEIERLGVETVPVWGFLPQRNAPPPQSAEDTLLRLVSHSDAATVNFVWDQIHLRHHPESYVQMPPADINEIYFPEFIEHLDGEVYIDAGAADGDTVREFVKRWTTYKKIIAFEPDPTNYRKLAVSCLDDIRHEAIQSAVSDRDGTAQFAASGDYSSHLGVGADEVYCYTLDCLSFDPPPTFIKMDIEGFEPQALWGARRLLKEYKPVLAICAYHEASHFWEIPLLIHALQPEYKLFFRRYAEGTFEIVWYGVPPDRVKQ